MVSARNVGFWIAAFLLTGVGQWVLAARLGQGWAALLFAGAAGAALVAWGGQPLTEGSPAGATPRSRWLALGGSIALAWVAWVGAGDNLYRSWGVLAWLLAIAFWLLGWGVHQRPAVPAPRSPLPAPWFVAAFVAILLVGGGFRFWGLDTLPPEMTSDHAEKLLDVMDVLEGQRPIFFIRNTGREPMQFYFTALLAGPLGLGLTHFALKFGTAIISWLTLPLTYALARHGLGLPRGTALLAMALLAFSKWHVAISRVGLRFPYAPFGVALTLIFFFRALRLHQRRDWLLAGVGFGISLYGYTPVRIVPLLLAVGAGLWLLLEQARGRTGLRWREALLNVALLPATALLVFLPLFRFSLEQPDQFWYRSSTRALEGAEGNLVSVFWGNVWNAARMFHVRGDVVWVNTLPTDPVLDRVTGALFLLGLAVAVGAVVRRWRAADAALLVALPVLVLPSVLALAWPRENPSVVRAGGALPVVMVLAALPLQFWIWEFRLWIAQRRTAPRRSFILLPSALLLLLSLVAFLNARVYFGPYAVQYGEESWNSSEVAQAILAREEAIGGVDHAYLARWQHWIDWRNVAFSLGHPPWHSVLNNVADLLSPETLPAEPRLVIVHPDDRATLDLLQGLWPGAAVETFQSRVPGKEFVIVVHPGYVE